MRLLRRKPPIWETDEWENLPWEEKMSIWRRHKRYSMILGFLWLSTFLGSATWWFSKYAAGGAGLRELGIVLACATVMGFILSLAGRLME